MFTRLAAFFALCFIGPAALSQEMPTAIRRADLQAGATFSFAKPDYGTSQFHGYGAYGDLDLRSHLGLEFNFHQLSGPNPVIYERTYQIGPRFIYPIHQRYVPYVKALYGRGVFNFPGTDATTGDQIQAANLAYNIGTIGGGMDFKLNKSLHIRVFDYEYQRWPSFPPHGLTPSILSFGIAYHFHRDAAR